MFERASTNPVDGEPTLTESISESTAGEKQGGGPISARKGNRFSFSLLMREIHATLPLGVYALKIIPFECQLDGGTFRALHIKVDLPPEKDVAFDRWWEDFEARNAVRIHPTREWAIRGIDHILRVISDGAPLLTKGDIPALDRRLEEFHRIPQSRSSASPASPIPLHRGIDLTSLPHITIDPATTLDREDALYAKQHTDGSISLYISFVDVTWYAERGSTIDKHIAARAYSVYGSYSAFPLLGREFAFGPGSFIQNEPRLAWTFELSISPEGEIVKRQFYRAAVTSRGAFTVEEVQRALAFESGDIAEVLRDLSEAARRLSIRRKLADRFVVLPPGEGKAALIVSECMITANVEAASLLEEAGRDGVYTTYALPSASQQEQLARRIRKCGIEVEPEHFSNARQFSTLWDALRQAGQHSILSEMLDRFFPRSLFSSLPNNHHGIPARSYLRLKGNTYVGIVNQWIFQALHEGKSPPFSPDALERIGHRQNRLMRSYDSAAFQLRFMEMLRRNLARQGELFTATIAEKREDDILFELHDDSFKKWGVARLDHSSPSYHQLSAGDRVLVTLCGFDRKENRFLFSLAGWQSVDEGCEEELKENRDSDTSA